MKKKISNCNLEEIFDCNVDVSSNEIVGKRIGCKFLFVFKRQRNLHVKI